MAVQGVRGLFDAVRVWSMGIRGARRTGPPGAAGVSELSVSRRSRSGPGPMHPGNPRPEGSPEVRDAAGERERHPADREDEPCAGAQDTFAQTTQAPDCVPRRGVGAPTFGEVQA